MRLERGPRPLLFVTGIIHQNVFDEPTFLAAGLSERWIKEHALADLLPQDANPFLRYSIASCVASSQRGRAKKNMTCMVAHENILSGPSQDAESPI